MGRIQILGDNPAGSDTKEEVIGGTCVKTFTGSLMPSGSDTLIPIELVEVDGEFIVIKEEVKKGANVREIGENFKKDEVLIKKGSRLGFAEIGVIASLNISQVEVFAKPIVGVLSTGSEILDVGDSQTNEAQIRSSNQFVLESLARKEGAKVIRHSLMGDDKELIRDAIESLLGKSDIVVTTGGVSVGDYDFVKSILADMEPKYITKGVFIKPGQHIKIVKLGKKYIVALPGFPFSSTVTFITYVVPIIRAMMGLKPKLKYKKAIITHDFKKKTNNKTEFHAGSLELKDGKYFVDFSSKRSGTSAILTNMLGKVALVKIDTKDDDLKETQEVDILDMEDF
jgi:molybdopterin molybdotransferase